ncbi:MAG: molybdenum ABC transporter ATP-binding protein [Pseudomonadota bacterium]
MSDSSLSISVSHAIDGFNLELRQDIPLNGVTAIFGPSGSGKTSALNTIAGFLRPKSGTVRFGSTYWFSDAEKIWVPPHRRSIGTVFQDAQLFPHLSVRGNLDFADRRSNKDKPGRSFEDIVSAMALQPLLERRPQTLSGGEKQRVAIARTLLTRPDLLLLDEPLSALDNARKGELLPFLETLKSDFAIPTLYVSHDVDEVSRIADRVIMMEDGKVMAVGRTDEILSRYGLEAGRNPYEETSTLTGSVDHTENDLLAVKVGATTIWLAADVHLETGTQIRLSIAARDVSIALARPSEISIQNMIAATVKDVQPTKRPAFQTVMLDVDGQVLQARVTRKAVKDLALQPGREVFALIKSATFHP